MSEKFFLPKIIGHRGARGTAPENTLISFKTAHKLGARWIELDVKETKDEVLIIMHDEELERTTNFKGKVAETSWNTIKTLDAGSWFSKDFINEKVPSLLEALLLFESLELGVNIEIKACPGKEESTAIQVANFIKKNWPKKLPPPLVSSFSMKSLKYAKKQNPDLIIGALFENKFPINWKSIAEDVNSTTINIDDDLITKEIIEQVKNAGYPILVYTVNTKERADYLFDLGITSIFTDFPEKF